MTAPVQPGIVLGLGVICYSLGCDEYGADGWSLYFIGPRTIKVERYVLARTFGPTLPSRICLRIA